MAEDSPPNIEKLFAKLAMSIGNDNLPELTRRCREILGGHSKAAKATSCGRLLHRLHESHLLTPYNWLQLVELLQDVGRYDIVGQVKSFCQKNGFPSACPDGESLPDVAVSHMKQIVFSVPVGLPPDEVVPNIMAAINMLVFQTGSNVMWYLGMESRGRARFLVQTRAAERIMAEVRKYPAWVVGLSVLIVECGEDVVTLTSKPEIPPEDIQQLQSDHRYQRLISKITGQFTDAVALITHCNVVMEPSEFEKASSVDEVLDVLLTRLFLTPYNLIQLAELMRQVGRSDLGRMLDHKSRRFAFFVASNETILPKHISSNRSLLCLELVGKRPTLEAIRNIMDAASMVLFQTATPTLWYLACVENVNFRLYFVIRNRELDGLMNAARNHVKWMKDLMIASVTVGSETVELPHNEAEDNEEDERHSRRLLDAAKESNVEVVATLLGLGADAEAKGKDHDTAVHRASQHGHKGVVEMLLKYGGRVDTQTKEESLQPLHLAAERGHLPVVEFLMTTEADVNAKAWAGLTPLHAASARGHLNVVDFLLTGANEKKADVNACDQDGDRPLHYAALEGHSNVALRLVNAGCPVDCRTKDGQTPLLWAAGNNHCGTAEVLLDRGANPDARDASRCTALHWAADNGHAAMAEILLDKGSEVNHQNVDGETALHWAASDGHVAFTRVLLDFGIGVDIKNGKGNTALHLCISEGHTAVVELLLDMGKASVNEPTKKGNSPLHLAAYGGHYRIADMLINHGADVNHVNNDSFTPLHAAAMNGSVAITGLLIQHQCNVSAKDKEEWTALHVAAHKNRGGVVELLLNSGSDPSSQDDHGRTPYHLAQVDGNVDVADIFKKRNAAISVL